MSDAVDLAFTAAVRTGELAGEMFVSLQAEARSLADALLVASVTADLDPSLPSSADHLIKFSVRATALADEIDSLLEQYRRRLIEIVAVEGEQRRERGCPIN